MGSESSIIWSVMFSAVGLGYFTYGRRQQNLVPLFCGIALMVYPYFVSNTWAMFGIGVALMAVPWFVRF